MYVSPPPPNVDRLNGPSAIRSLIGRSFIFSMSEPHDIYPSKTAAHLDLKCLDIHRNLSVVRIHFGVILCLTAK